MLGFGRLPFFMVWVCLLKRGGSCKRMLLENVNYSHGGFGGADSESEAKIYKIVLESDENTKFTNSKHHKKLCNSRFCNSDILHF